MNSPKKPASKTASKTKKKYRKTKEELNAEGRERKRQKKHRGNKSGARYQEKSSNSQSGKQNDSLDPRLGSKKPVPLVVDANAVSTRTTPVKEPVAKVKLSPEQELEMLEQDDRLDSLLARLEEGETVTTEEQKYIDTCLDRIDELMSILGIELTDEEEEEDEEKLDDIMRILKSQ
ncbi:Der GTPase-activating protein YihI [Providencia vermicola]|uniref:Der GTPase-activating protein YihI n=1 Tax=Providencia vermicola TaxID=333965 RepID=A0AAX3S3A9_9GAMM|nr:MULTISPECIES: Der GTPase-activating protein YihI [Providencia]ELX8380139.1 Der GTPase-activating protein YihI [Providencia stuartii]ELX8381566.1 Der GTPase-activating protein YihI [Providencia stuartii]EMD5259676.1 Der GTPase-activating protein YihI [Providencia stuartii]EMD5260793.1 Der GTPase-activating protein YihI [Providencia stuartii]USB38106.1 Der GTPase-activating protein YihI [Providencia vermicola]